MPRHSVARDHYATIPRSRSGKQFAGALPPRFDWQPGSPAGRPRARQTSKPSYLLGHCCAGCLTCWLARSLDNLTAGGAHLSDDAHAHLDLRAPQMAGAPQRPDPTKRIRHPDLLMGNPPGAHHTQQKLPEPGPSCPTSNRALRQPTYVCTN